MDVNIEKKTETKREVKVTITPEEMEKFKKKVGGDFAEKMNIKGFRPGRAPLDVIENTVGSEKLYEEAAKEAIQETYPKIVEQNNLFAISSPQVDILKCAPGNEVVYKAIVYIMPEINLPEYKEIAKKTAQKEGKDIEVSEKEVDEMIERVRENKAEMKKVDRVAKKGDAVIINFKGVFGGNEEKKVEEKNFQVVLGGGEMSVIEGFEDELIGMKSGEKKSFSVDIPKTKDKGEFAGQKIDFEVEVISVMERNLPEVDDNFAKTFPQIESLEQLKERIKEGMKKEKEAKESERIKEKVLENIKKEVDFEVPDILTEKEVDNMINSIKNQLAQNNASFENYLKEIGKEEEDLRKEWRGKAEENVSYALLLHKISEKEDIKVSPEEIEKEVERHFSTTSRQKEEEKEENLQRMRSYIHDNLKNKKVFELLYEK